MAKDINKKEIDEKKKKEDKMQSIFFIAMMVLCVAGIGFLAFRSALKKDNNSDESSNKSEMITPVSIDYTFYSKNLDMDGKIIGINARDYVELPDWTTVELESAAISRDETPINNEDGQKKATRNAIMKNAKVKSYPEAYLNDLKKQFEVTYEHERQMLHDIYKQVGKERYTTVYEYLDVKNQEEYEAFIQKSAEEEASLRLIMQAILEEYSLNNSMEYGEDYCKARGLEVNAFIEKYGLNYYRQCCIEYAALDYTFSVLLKK